MISNSKMRHANATFQRSSNGVAKKMMLAVVGLVVVLVAANLLEHYSIHRDIHRALCGDSEHGVLNKRLSSLQHRILCEWNTPLEDQTFQESYEQALTYDTYDPDNEAPETTLAFVLTVPPCDTGNVEDPGAAFYDAAAVLKDSICNCTATNPDSGSNYDATMYAIIHPDDIFCEAPTSTALAQNGGTSRRLNSNYLYRYDRVQILQELGFWVKIMGEPDVAGTSRDLLLLYAYNFTRHSAVLSVKLDTVLTALSIDDAIDGFLGASATVYWERANNADLVNLGTLLIKPSFTEMNTILNRFGDLENDATYSGGISLAEYLFHYYSNVHQSNTLRQHDFALSFNEDFACGKPWLCYYEDTWDSVTNQKCLLLNNAWYSFRAEFETRWSKQELVDTSLGEYHPNFFLGYCYGEGANGYQRAADFSSASRFSCPTQDGETINLGSSGGVFELELSNTGLLCTLTKVMTDGSTSTPFPIARSYDAFEWESAAGPLATQTFEDNDIRCDYDYCSMTLPSLTEANYVLTAFNHSISPRDEAARFLEMATFGPLSTEIDAITDVSRAGYISSQMDETQTPITSHREYWRKRTNPKSFFPIEAGRSNHPCNPYSLWRRYTFLWRHDEDGTDTIKVRYLDPYNEPLIFEAENAAFNNNHGEIKGGGNGFTGSGFVLISADSGPSTLEFPVIEWNVHVPQEGTYPLSIRYAVPPNEEGLKWKYRFNKGSSDLYIWQNTYEIGVNGNLVGASVNFLWTNSGQRWYYTDTIEVNLNAGSNTIQLLYESNPRVVRLDHLRIGLERRAALEVNGHVLTVVDGIKNAGNYNYEFEESHPYKLARYHTDGKALPPDMNMRLGRTFLEIGDGKTRQLDFGNPAIDLTGFEDLISNNWFGDGDDPFFILPESGINFTETYNSAAGLYKRGSREWDYYLSSPPPRQEMLLVNGIDSPACANIPDFVTGYDASPVFGRQPDGTWYVWTPTLQLEENTPSSPSSDGGGSVFVATDEQSKCMNAPRTWLNEDGCILSNSDTACKTSETLSGANILLNEASIINFYHLNFENPRYVYAMKGFALDDSVSKVHNPCEPGRVSRWEINVNTICSEPTVGLHNDTIIALNEMLNQCSDANSFIKDCKFHDVDSGFACAVEDKVVREFAVQIGDDCYTLVHPEHMDVYDCTDWSSVHPGGELRIKQWAENSSYPGWYMIYPSNTPGIPSHDMSRWTNNHVYFQRVGRFGDNVKFRDLPNGLRTLAIAEEYGADPESVAGTSVLVCGSVGEVSNDKALGEQYHQARFNTKSGDYYGKVNQAFDKQKNSVWYTIALTAEDQLRQRVAWALSLILVVSPNNLNKDYAVGKSEMFLNFYDIFVRNAFGNYLDILKEISYSPLMGENLSFLWSKSHAYIFQEENKKVAFADENFAREMMQLFSIGLVKLEEDGRPKLDSNRMPLPTYTNDHIISFARAWTGFVLQHGRGNIEDEPGQQYNHIDPMTILATWRDRFPKIDLGDGYVGDRFPLCADFPEKMFLKEGATYRLLGGTPRPQSFDDNRNFYLPGVKHLVLNATTSFLYGELHNGGVYRPVVRLQNSYPCVDKECVVDTVRVVKVADVYYEYKQAACVQQAFYNGGKKIERRDRIKEGTICANPSLPHAGEACCNQSEYLSVYEASRNYVYENERMKYSTAEERCDANLCEYKEVAIPDDMQWKTHYHWTSTDCFIQAKVNSEGMVAIVHDASHLPNRLPLHLSEESLNYFMVFWEGGVYPTVQNNCGNNQCKALPDGDSCLCQAYVENMQYFPDVASITSTDDIIASLKIGHTDPALYSAAYTERNHVDLQNNTFVTYEKDDFFDENTVFKVADDKGREFFLKNIKSTVKLQGWSSPPQIIEAEAAENTLAGVIIQTSNDNQATGGQFAKYDPNYGVGAYIDWNVTVASAGIYRLKFKTSHWTLSNSLRPLKISVNGVVVDPKFGFENTGDYQYFHYSKPLDVTLNAGGNVIRTEAILDPSLSTSAVAYVACGDKDKDDCFKREGSTEFVDSLDATHEVRCCSDTAKDGWNKADTCDVWAQSDLAGADGSAPECQWRKTYFEADAICAANGGRLCTKLEILNRCTINTGCDFDVQFIWTSSAPESPLEPGQWTICGKNGGYCNSGGGYVADRWTSEEDSAHTRCCSDTPIPGWTQKDWCSVYTTSGSCSGEITYDAAVQFCANEGGRLCTKEEYLDNCASGTGCNYDHELLWTSTPGWIEGSLGPNIDHLHVEGLSTNLTYAFPNPPHFMSLIQDYDDPSGGIGETTLRDAQYETEAVLETYFYHDNVAPFLCTRFIQRFGSSNPSPRYVKECSRAFKTGSYTSDDGIQFGAMNYGDLKAAFAAVILDREAQSSILEAEPSAGLLKEPILKIVGLMRSMNYTHKFDGPLLPPSFFQNPYDKPSVFSFFQPDYTPQTGPVSDAMLNSPESGMLDMSNNIELLNGMFFLIKYGATRFVLELQYHRWTEHGWFRNLGYEDGVDDGEYKSAWGYLNYSPSGETMTEKIDDLSTLLTAGRLSKRSKLLIESAVNAYGGDLGKRIRFAQQLIVSSPEFHSTSLAKMDSNATRSSFSGPPPTSNSSNYKAVVLFSWFGGVDSFNMITPYTCPQTGLWEKYVAIRDSVAMSKENLLEIPANSAQPCDTFGLHHRFTKLKDLYDQNQVLFIANAGLLTKTINTTSKDWVSGAHFSLFDHFSMFGELHHVDPYREISGTGPLGRMSTVLNLKGKRTGAFATNNWESIALAGKTPATSSIKVSSQGSTLKFNPKSSSADMTEHILSINNATLQTSGYMSETWSSEIVRSITDLENMEQILWGASGEGFNLISTIMQSHKSRGVDVDFFTVSNPGNMDSHSDNQGVIDSGFGGADSRLHEFVQELKENDLWDNVVIVQMSEFGRSLAPNSGAGTDHGWGGNYFMLGGRVNGGKIIGKYPDGFEPGDSGVVMDRRGRLIPSTPFDAIWQGVSEWLGLTPEEIDTVLPNRHSFDPSTMFDKDDLFTPDPPSA